MFQSTHSLRSATSNGVRIRSARQFQSTHSLRSATDQGGTHDTGQTRFNPRTPCGVRPDLAGKIHTVRQFQSTHSLRSATNDPGKAERLKKVSIHALLAECDFPAGLGDRYPRGFNPRTPCGVRPVRLQIIGTDRNVSIHALLAECDKNLQSLQISRKSFNPRTPCGVRLRPTLYIATQQSKSYFAPTSLKRPSLHGCSF